jgi:polar amino acid transport system substrate-binding protein
MKYLALIVLLSLLVFCGSPVWADELTILTEEWKPISFSGEDGKPTGLAVEIVQEILRRLNVPDTIEIVPWRGRIERH